MSNWKESGIHVGTLKPGQTATAIYEYLGDKTIVRVTGSCGCNDISYTQARITVKYHAPSAYPEHLARKNQDSYSTTKNIVVRYEDDSLETLTLTARIERK